MNIPNDPVILLSYINTQLRDFYPSLTEFCKSMNQNQNDIINKLAAIDYHYDENKNQFV